MVEARSTAPLFRRTIDPQPLATRVPASLRRRLLLYCAEHDVHVQDFVRAALEEALRKRKRRR
jgi:hypothetical protein